MSEWIVAKKCAPQNGVKVLCCVNDIISEWCEVLFWDGMEWSDANGNDFPCIVTHWMPLPEMPKD